MDAQAQLLQLRRQLARGGLLDVRGAPGHLSAIQTGKAPL
jgi:hypothetical protein